MVSVGRRGTECCIILLRCQWKASRVPQPDFYANTPVRIQQNSSSRYTIYVLFIQLLACFNISSCECTSWYTFSDKIQKGRGGFQWRALCETASIFRYNEQRSPDGNTGICCKCRCGEVASLTKLLSGETSPQRHLVDRPVFE